MSNVSALANWPPVNGPTTVLVNRTEAAISLNGSVSIDAPAAVVWPILRDISYYPDWFKFFADAEITSQPANLSESEDPSLLYFDTKFNVTVIAADNSTSLLPQAVSDYSTPNSTSSRVPQSLVDDGTFYGNLSNLYRIAWITDQSIAGDSLKTERYTDIIITGNNTSLLRTWELQAGPAAQASVPLKPVLDAGYVNFLATIKNQSEYAYQRQLDDDNGDDQAIAGGYGYNSTSVNSESKPSPSSTGNGNRGGNSADVVAGAPGFSGP